jgi:glucosyl-3-phosphoglycerate synthase
LLVKAFYTRMFEGAPTGGGRVTELVARPLLSLLFPKLVDIVQPLAGEYAARRSTLEALPFVEGWGVELALLIDVVERFGRDAVVQVDLGAREHRNRPLADLAPQATEVMAAGLQRAGMLESSAVRERPPMFTVAGYRARFGLPR